MRHAHEADIPFLSGLYEHRRAEWMVSTIIEEPFWRWVLAGQSPTTAENWTAQIIENGSTGDRVGYALTSRVRWNTGIGLNDLVVTPEVPLTAVLPSVLRALRNQVADLPTRPVRSACW